MGETSAVYCLAYVTTTANKYVMPVVNSYFDHVTRNNGLEKTIMQEIVTEESRDKDRRMISQIYLLRWQQHVGWWRTGIGFARMFGQRRPEEDMLS